MKILFVLISLYSFTAMAADLSGKWINLRDSAAKPISFVKIKDHYYFHSQERFIFTDGRLSHTIDQSVKIKVSNENTLEGTVDFYDSRGCSFKDYAVVVEFQRDDLANVLMTVPRYKFVTTTVTNQQYDRPRYCRDPYNRVYICGREPVVVSRTSECRLMEKIEVPVELQKI